MNASTTIAARHPIGPLTRAGLAAAMLTAIAACTTSTPRPAPAPTPEPPKPVSTAQAAEVILTAASASLVSGKLAVRPVPDGVRLTGEIGGLSPGPHAIHIHENGDCSAVDASSAGGHFSPGSNPHGRVGQGPHHGGDMDNIHADGGGVAQVDVGAVGVTLGGGAVNDVAGRAVIVHAAADDYVSQPAGNAGKRVACGIIRITR